jgi:HEAT repeat protein
MRAPGLQATKGTKAHAPGLAARRMGREGKSMGLFDLFKGGGGSKGVKKERPKSGAASKWADRIEKRVQNYDRQEAIQALANMANADAAAVLLKRFTFHMDPSITDQEEKDSAFRGILRAGKDAIDPVRAFAAKAESLAWPMKIMKELVDTDEYIDELLRWLSRWDTEYAKFVDPKVQILTALEEHKHPRIREGVERFLEDVNEPARFHAVSALLAQDDEAAVPALTELLAGEESVRIRTKIAEGLAQRGWTVLDEQRDAVRKALPPTFAVDAKGLVVKR